MGYRQNNTDKMLRDIFLDYTESPVKCTWEQILWNLCQGVGVNNIQTLDLQPKSRRKPQKNLIYEK